MPSKHTRTRLLMRNGKKVRAHRWIMEQHIGRPLTADEEVHHINHDPLDNRLDNLQIVTRAEHIALHAVEKQRYADVKACAKCGAAFTVNPRKRSRNKTCSAACAAAMRADGRRAQVAEIIGRAVMTSEDLV